MNQTAFVFLLLSSRTASVRWGLFLRECSVELHWNAVWAPALKGAVCHDFNFFTHYWSVWAFFLLFANFGISHFPRELSNSSDFSNLLVLHISVCNMISVIFHCNLPFMCLCLYTQHFLLFLEAHSATTFSAPRDERLPHLFSASNKWM